jgi:hypothetical protein
MPTSSSSVCNMDIRGTESLACKCSTSWQVGKPTPAKQWRTCWGSIATRLAAGWPSTLLATLLDTYVHTGKPVSLAPEVLTRLEQGLHRPADFASYEALRQWVGGRTAWRSSTRPCMRWCVRASGPSSKRPGPVTRKKLEAIPAFQAAYQA